MSNKQFNIITASSVPAANVVGRIDAFQLEKDQKKNRRFWILSIVTILVIIISVFAAVIHGDPTSGSNVRIETTTTPTTTNTSL